MQGRIGRVAAAVAWVVLGCERTDGPAVDEVADTEEEGSGAEGKMDDVDESAGGSSGSDGEVDSDAFDSTGEDDVEAGCAEPVEVPELDPDATDLYCPPGTELDRTYRLCVTDTLAVGPFPLAMQQACTDCLGGACDEPDWGVEQARGLRGTTVCPPGTNVETGGVCFDEAHAWGPFSPELVSACEAAGGGSACDTMRWARDFAEALIPDEPQPGNVPWSYILDEDFGVRDDGLGGGHFGAPRSGNPGGHSGIDFLAPVGTPLRAPCPGPIISGVAGGYGNYVQLSCPIPDEVAQGQELWASMLYAHLDTISVATGASVDAGDLVGTVGKTGNAASGGINAHVHFEIAIHGSLAAAQGEPHISSDHSGNAASDTFAQRIAESCWSPHAFQPLTGPSTKGRRPDPFMVLSCLSDKPALVDPPASLQGLREWSLHYDAAFDVDVGP